jgi:hypothetical protein
MPDGGGGSLLGGFALRGSRRYHESGREIFRLLTGMLVRDVRRQAIRGYRLAAKPADRTPREDMKALHDGPYGNMSPFIRYRSCAG